MTQKIKTVLVTGASRGIGRGIAVALAGAGYSVAVNYAGNRSAAEETVQLCRAAGRLEGQAFASFQADISIPDDRSRLLSAVTGHFGEFHGLINNAGVAPEQRLDLLSLTEESLDRLNSINLKGPLFLTQETANLWLENSRGPDDVRNIIFITSVSSTMVSLNRGDYCITKAGLSMSVQLFARRLADENISVFEIRPGIIRTDMTSAVQEKYDTLIGDGLVPQRRWGLPEDIGKAAASLMSGSFAYSTGSVIHVDGGLHIPLL